MSKSTALGFGILTGIAIGIGWSVAAQTTTSWTAPIGRGEVVNCCADGQCWLERGQICHSKLSDRQPVVATGNGVITNSYSITNSSTPQPKCEDGWTLVADLNLRPMCARELKEPSSP